MPTAGSIIDVVRVAIGVLGLLALGLVGVELGIWASFKLGYVEMAERRGAVNRRETLQNLRTRLRLGLAATCVALVVLIVLEST
jgi:hypothetical protein